MNSNTELRDNRRFKYIAYIYHDNLLPGIFYTAKMYNLSKSGVYFESDQPIHIGDYINLKIKSASHSSGNEAQYHFSAEIKWRKDLQDSSFRHGYGAKFINSNESLNKILNIANLEVQNPQESDWTDEKDPRQHPRRPYNTSLSFTSKNQSFKGLITNISRGGAFIETQNRFSLGQIIQLVFPGYKKRKDLKLKGYVVRLNRRGMGVKFDRRSGRSRRSDLDRRSGLDRRGSRRRKFKSTVEP
jgi:Tfp pilus assembly protein PilZ